MGSWLLEVGKMALYMSFPVGLFHYFNQPEYFEQFVIKKKRDMYPHEDEWRRKEIEGVIRLMNEKEERKAMQALEAIEVERKLRKAQASQ